MRHQILKFRCIHEASSVTNNKPKSSSILPSRKNFVKSVRKWYGNLDSHVFFCFLFAFLFLINDYCTRVLRDKVGSRQAVWPLRPVRTRSNPNEWDTRGQSDDFSLKSESRWLNIWRESWKAWNFFIGYKCRIYKRQRIEGEEATCELAVEISFSNKVQWRACQKWNTIWSTTRFIYLFLLFISVSFTHIFFFVANDEASYPTRDFERETRMNEWMNGRTNGETALSRSWLKQNSDSSMRLRLWKVWTLLQSPLVWSYLEVVYDAIHTVLRHLKPSCVTATGIYC